MKISECEKKNCPYRIGIRCPASSGYKKIEELLECPKEKK
jgi:hypothetical protein